MAVFPHIVFSSPLGIVTDGLVLNLDARDSASYSGSGQTWADLTANGYDYHLGKTGSAEADDPTYDAGPPAHFDMDGGDVFGWAGAGSSPTEFQAFHKQNANFTIEVWVYTPATWPTNWGICGNKPFGLGNRTGHAFWVLNGNPFFYGEISGTSTSWVTDNAVGTSGWHQIAVSIDEAAGAGGGFFCVDGAYSQVSSSNTFNATYSQSGTTDASDLHGFGCIAATASGDVYEMTSGSSVAIARVYTQALTLAQLQQNWNATRGDFSL